MGSDAEYMYENDLDPFHRKDKETGRLVEWEGGLNPDYREDYEENCCYRETSLQIKKFNTFQDAKEWAKENPGRSIAKSPDGNGFVVKGSTSDSTSYNVKGSNRQYGHIRPRVYGQIKNYLTREKAEADNFTIKSMIITLNLAEEISLYIKDNDIQAHFFYTPENMCIIGVEERCNSSDEVCQEKAKKKTILDLYFEILSKSPNNLLNINFKCGKDKPENDEIPF